MLQKVLENQFIKFLGVGVINTAFGYAVYALFIYLGFHYSIASFLSTIFGIIFNFKTIGQLVFKQKSNRFLLKFIGVYTFVYILNLSFLSLFSVFHFDMIYAGAILVLPMAVIAYLLNKKLVFK